MYEGLWDEDKCGKTKIMAINDSEKMTGMASEVKVDKLRYLGNILTGDQRCKERLKARMAVAKEVLNIVQLNLERERDCWSAICGV